MFISIGLVAQRHRLVRFPLLSPVEHTLFKTKRSRAGFVQVLRYRKHWGSPIPQDKKRRPAQIWPAP